MNSLIKFFAPFALLTICISCKQTIEYQVFALRFCDKGEIQAKEWIIGADHNDSIDVGNFYWLLKDPKGRNILVDAGFIDSSNTTKNYLRPDSVLQQLNISTQEISDIIITHPHSDHMGGISLYPNARIWMNQDDYEYFIVPAWEPPGNSKGLNKQIVLNINTIKSQGRLNLIKGDNIEILPGIRAFTGSKHTFQNMYILVNSNSEKNKILLASDAIWFYLNLDKELPISICFDTASYVKAIRRMKNLVSNPNLIVPGHDNNVLLRFPKVNDNIVSIKESK